ncbi:GGDEF domain-containing protein [Asanoa sp. NPDC049573]|uniref:GGDEF domain-containing protein n=1 Tax=Asanoa sp. NPDC049573 TaxID=3155396 RepID=UPI003416F70A
MPKARTPQLRGYAARQALRAGTVGVVLLLGLMAATGTLGSERVILATIPFAACAVICLLHAHSGGQHCRAWTAAGLAMAALLAGNLLTSQGEAIHTAVGDTLTVLGYLLLYLFVALLWRSDQAAFTGASWLDGIVATLGIAALACVGGFDDRPARIGVHLAGLVLFVVLILRVTAGRPRLDRTQALVVAAFGAACVTDGMRTLNHLTDTFTEHAYLVVLSLALPTLLAFAPTPEPTAAKSTTPPVVSWQTLAVPAFFSVSSLLLLTIGQSAALPMLSSSLAAACVLAVFARAGLTFKELRDLRDVYQQARTDDLTGLPNRRALYEHLDGLCASGTPGSLLLLDLDGFKEVNDSVGHAAGDQVLVQTADRIRNVLTPSQVLARLGGDEFAISLPAASLTEAIELAWRIHLAVTCPSQVADTQIRLGVSIGVTGSHLTEARSGELLRTADIAMYAAKRQGGGVAPYKEPAAATPARRLDPHLSPLA